MSDKLISLESVLKEIRRFKGYIDDDMIERFSIAFKRLPTVPHEMTAREFLKIIENLNYYDHEAYQRYARRKMQYDYAGAVAVVKNWAQEHPERSEE